MWSLCKTVERETMHCCTAVSHCLCIDNLIESLVENLVLCLLIELIMEFLFKFENFTQKISTVFLNRITIFPTS